MEFTPIETQEQFDSMVKERVERLLTETALLLQPLHEAPAVGLRHPIDHIAVQRIGEKQRLVLLVLPQKAAERIGALLVLCRFRAEEQLTSKESEIEALKAKITDFESEKKTSDESYHAMEKELSELKLKALKTRVAMDAGLPADLADRLTGDDEETLKADAEKLASFVGSKKVAPSFNHEDAPTDPAEAGFREMAQLFERK